VLGLVSHGVVGEWTNGSVEAMKSEENRGSKGRVVA
jgi:hypothetical protein